MAGLTIANIRDAVREQTLEVYLATNPHPALLEFGALAPDPELSLEASAAIRLKAQERRLQLIQRARDLPQRPLYYLRPARGEEVIVIGRSAKHASAVLPDGTISKRHLRVIRRDGGWSAQDLESQNGTIVEGRRLPAGIPTPLLGGQSLQLSQTDTVFLTPQQIWSLVAPGGSGLVLPPEGLAIKELIGFLAGMTREVFLDTCPHPFLLQVPTDVTDTDPEPEDLDSTLPLSQTRIISLQRRSSKLSGALVHYLDPSQGALVLGRRGGPATLQVPEPSVSKRHAELNRAGERWLVTDLGSHNGTWIEGQRIESGLAVALQDGQAISFSSYRSLYLGAERVFQLVERVGGKVKG